MDSPNQVVGVDYDNIPDVDPVMVEKELPHFRELGLGRGIDCTDPEMWNNKTKLQIRDLNKGFSNAIGLNENGIKHIYEKSVTSRKSQQTKIKLALNVPSSHVKIGMDAHHSQSTENTVTIKGERVRTRTISFKTSFDDLPASSTFSKESGSYVERDDMFENNLAKWLLHYLKILKDAKRLPEEPVIPLDAESPPIDQLVKFIQELMYLGEEIMGEHSEGIAEACRVFVSDLRVTHYVNSIELGALKYSVESIVAEKSAKGVGGNLEAASAASAGGSFDISTETEKRTKEEQLIGSFNDKGVVRRNTSDETVIGFEILPISRLVRVPIVQKAMNVAIEVYITSKTDRIVGPYVISTTINRIPVYWKVDEQTRTLIGTGCKVESSLFHLIPQEKSTFTIAYWGDNAGDRHLLTHMNHPGTQFHKKAPTLPFFVTASQSLRHYWKAPLLLETTFPIQIAQFSLYSRVQRSFACLTWDSIPSNVSTWLEGDMFYLKHKRNLFKSDYLVLKKTSCNEYTSVLAFNNKELDKDYIRYSISTSSAHFQRRRGGWLKYTYQGQNLMVEQCMDIKARM